MQHKAQIQKQKSFKKQYSVFIPPAQPSEKPEDRIQLVMKEVTPVINRIISDAMLVAIGTWPTPEIPIK